MDELTNQQLSAPWLNSAQANSRRVHLNQPLDNQQFLLLIRYQINVGALGLIQLGRVNPEYWHELPTQILITGY